MSSGVAGSIAGAPLAHRVGADGAVGDLAAHVDRELLLADRVEVLGIGLPAPGDALGQRGAGDVLDALHQLDQPLLTAGPHRGEADTAVAGHERRDAVAAGRLEQAVPADLPVVVGVDVDEAGGHHMPCRVDGFGGLAAHRRIVGAAADHVDDLAVLDADVGLVALGTRAVDDSATGDLEVEHEFPPSLFGVAMGWLAEAGGRETGGRPASADHYATPRTVNSEGIRRDGLNDSPPPGRHSVASIGTTVAHPVGPVGELASPTSFPRPARQERTERTVGMEPADRDSQQDTGFEDPAETKPSAR